jgi:hypothetical protein
MRRLPVCAALVLGASFAAAQEAAGPPPIPEGRPPEWSVEAGYGFQFKVNRGRSNEHLFLFQPGVSFRLGPRLEWVIEGHFARYTTPEGYMIGVLPLEGRYYVGHGKYLPYLFLGAGLGWTDLERLDEIDRRFNFLLAGGVGIRGAVSATQAWTVEARWSHVSNAGTELPNLGLNMLVFLLGWRF